MLRSNLGAGYALVPVPEDLNPDHGNVIRRGSGVLVPAHAGNMVERSPNSIIPDYESGWQFEYPPLSTQMFLPDGRLVQRTPGASGFDGVFGAGPTLPPLAAFIFGGGILLASVAGLTLAKRGKRVRGAVYGAALGGITLFGAALGPWLYRVLATPPASPGTVAA